MTLRSYIRCIVEAHEDNRSYIKASPALQKVMKDISEKFPDVVEYRDEFHERFENCIVMLVPALLFRNDKTTAIFPSYAIVGIESYTEHAHQIHPDLAIVTLERYGAIPSTQLSRILSVARTWQQFITLASKMVDRDVYSLDIEPTFDERIHPHSYFFETDEWKERRDEYLERFNLNQ
jgi:hypothetical protein